MSKLNSSLQLLFFALLLPYGFSIDNELHTVDTNRASQQFLSGASREAGHTYLDTMKLTSISQMQLGEC
jgi:hypothetical protein